ncbi:MAG: recombinase family protein [Parasporobacterium sp.]|nr:recombinase family protein [Parasporobacterium sp.]
MDHHKECHVIAEIETFHYEPPAARTKSKGIMRVAAYCRVSTLMEDQELSFETQTDYYRSLIENSPGMELVGIYGDQGFSGLSVDKRREFQRMIQDCRLGKIDMVMVKSISRFSRNTTECMQYINELRELGIAVLFEKEGINTLDKQSEIILSIYASIAQNESCSKSESIRWAKRCRAEMGNPARAASYGYRIERHPGESFRYWVIHEEEARHVRLMFDLAYQGYSTFEICQKLNEMENKRGGKILWKTDRLRHMLRNETYKGDVLTHKVVKTDYLMKQSVKNKGHMEQFYIEGHHPAIVAPEVFDEVQSFLEEGRLNGRNIKQRREWLNDHPEILLRRIQYSEK